MGPAIGKVSGFRVSVAGRKKNKVFQADFIRVDLIVVADFVGVVLDDWLVHPGLE